MIKYILILGFLPIFSTGYSQHYDMDQVKAKAVDIYEKAVVLLRNESLKEGVPLLLEAIKIDSNFVDAYLSLGGVFGQLKQYKRSILFYEIGKSKDSIYFKPYELPYSINLAGDGRFKDALDAVNRFLLNPKLNERSIKSAAYRKNTYQFALHFSATHPNTNYEFIPVNLGDSINTSSSEYYPSVTVTDSLLVFTRRKENKREDFFQSSTKEKKFGKAHIIQGDINIEPQKGAITVSQDGEWMLFAGQFAEQHANNFDIYISFLTPQGWSEPQNMGDNINTEFWESAPSLSPDKRTLYFSSNRPGGSGGADLYCSHQLANGRWTPAENLGNRINSAGDDQAPFIHADNQTMYFTSDGLTGYGGADLFILRKNSKGEWGDPVNLGYPINTIENEGSLAVSADGLTAFYASDRSDSRGELDLYRFQLRPDIRPYRTLYVKGKVTDLQTGKSLPSSVELINNSDGMVLMKIQTDETGSYFITLPTGKDYTFSVNRKGYFSYNELYELSKSEADSVYQKNIALQPIKLNAIITFKNIEFANNEFNLPSTATIELEKLVTVLQENPSLTIEIGGHTDYIGRKEDNIRLSKNRAKAIVDFLIAKGVDATRLKFSGYGDSIPIGDNKTGEGRAKNRRTTVTITRI
ncbi:MAG: flagellar motor protein MotB [Sphingobacteriia bacterium]|nr:MAG: flagellar motor protein MotB [Sphingobacteriia bacterium]TAG29535.1 MAG: flagellar motor protein MotB [Sphingobacteriia bacterium]